MSPSPTLPSAADLPSKLILKAFCSCPSMRTFTFFVNLEARRACFFIGSFAFCSRSWLAFRRRVIFSGVGFFSTSSRNLSNSAEFDSNSSVLFVKSASPGVDSESDSGVVGVSLKSSILKSICVGLFCSIVLL